MAGAHTRFSMPSPRFLFVFLLAAAGLFLTFRAVLWHRIPTFRERAPLPSPAHLAPGERYCLTYELDTTRARSPVLVSTAMMRLDLGGRARPVQEHFARYAPGSRREVRVVFDTSDTLGVDSDLRITAPRGAAIRRRVLYRMRGVARVLEGLIRGLVAAAGGALLWSLWGRAKALAGALALGLTLYAVVSAALPPSRIGDPYWNTPTGLSILMMGDTNVDEFKWQASKAMRFVTTHHAGHLYNYFPIGMTLLCLPTDALGIILFDRDVDAIDGFTAHVLFACLGGLFFYLTERLRFKTGSSLLLTALLLGGTPNIWYGTGGTNSHTGVQILLVAALLLLCVGAHSEKAGVIALSAVPLTAACVVRPTAVVVLATFTVYVALSQRRALARFLLLGFSVGVAFLGFNWFVYHAFLPPYFDAQRLSTRTLLLGLAAQTLSPNRGLFVYGPVFLFCFSSAWRALRGKDPLARTIAFTPLPFGLMVAAFPAYSGGWGFGSRFYLDVAPLLVLLLAPVVNDLGLRRHPVRTILFALAAAYTLWAHSRILGCWDVFAWNFDRVNVMQHQERVWDWKDMQILRCLHR